MIISFSFQYKEADLAMCGISQTSLRDTVVDFGYPYFMTGMGLLTKKPSKSSKIFAIVLPYDLYVWIGLAMTLPTFALVYWVFTNVQKTGFRQSFTLGKVVSEISQIIVKQGENSSLISKYMLSINLSSLNQGIKQWPVTWKDRILLLSWALFALVITYGKNSYLLFTMGTCR